MAGSPSLFLRLFTVAPDQSLPFVALVGFLGPLLGIAFGFDGGTQGESVSLDSDKLIDLEVRGALREARDRRIERGRT